MKHQIRPFVLAAVITLALTAMVSAQPRRERRAPPPPPIGVYSTVSGSISQLNYSRDAIVESFLLNDKTLVHLPPNVAAVIGPTLHSGDNVEISGLANSTRNGMRTIEAQEIRDRTSGKTFSVPQPGPAAPYSGSGRIQQLNYGPDGTVNGFLLDNGTLVDVPPFSASNPSSIRSGAAVSFSGYARSTVAGRTVVDAQTLSINGQTLTIGAEPAGRGVPPPPPTAPPEP